MHVTKTTLSMEFYTQQENKKWKQKCNPYKRNYNKIKKKVLHFKLKNVEANVPRESEESDSVSEEEWYCSGCLGEDEQKHWKK